MEPATTPAVALTFDDGPTPATTERLVALLCEAGAAATVFVQGNRASERPDLLRAYADAGLVVANHSWDHPDLTTLPLADARDQLARTQDVVTEVLGVTPTMFRPPYGATNPDVVAVAAELGLTQVLWDVEPKDWDGTSATLIRERVASATAGDVVLLHDWPPATLEALPGILADLRARGLRPAPLDTRGRPA